MVLAQPCVLKNICINIFWVNDKVYNKRIIIINL